MSKHPPSAPSAGPLAFTDGSLAAFRPANDARITGGLWHTRRTVNAGISIPRGFELLEEVGNLHNLRLAAGQAEGEYIADHLFMDSDVYKWLEAAAWQLGDPATDPARAAELGTRITEVARLLSAAQEPSGYLHSHYQMVQPELRFKSLAQSHELYCAGHLIQAAVAHVRATGRTELLDVARRFADHIDSVFGREKGRIDGVCGHPQIETALVELYRCTGERRYCELAGYFVDRRGHGLVPDELYTRRYGPRYCQDRLPVREAESVVGHAVRQLYLLAGVVDVHAETGDRSLLEAAERLWEEMAATRTYLTGGVGTYHSNESFGDPFELPADRAHTETCAAIASAMFSWRLLLATGRARYADHLERVLFNGFLTGVSLDGERYAFVNPLQVRDGHVDDGGKHGAFRSTWFFYACCPPNVMRLLASLPHYMAASNRAGLILHQYATGSYAADGFGADGFGTDDGRVAVDVATDYPWNGRIEVTVTQTPDVDWTLTLRIPHWAADRWKASVAGTPVEGAADNGWLRLARRWQRGDTVVLDLELAPRLSVAPARVDAVRGCVAIERGPLVYCVERADQPDGTRLDDLRLDPAQPLNERWQPGLLGGVVTVSAAARMVPPPSGDDWWPYAETGPGARTAAPGDGPGPSPVPLTAIPYHVWAHREEGPMRVWLPLVEAGPADRRRDSGLAGQVR